VRWARPPSSIAASAGWATCHRRQRSVRVPADHPAARTHPLSARLGSGRPGLRPETSDRMARSNNMPHPPTKMISGWACPVADHFTGSAARLCAHGDGCKARRMPNLVDAAHPAESLASIHRQRCVTLALMRWIPFVASVIRRLDIEIGVHLIDAQMRRCARFTLGSVAVPVCRMPRYPGAAYQCGPRPIQ
jgi:hypothetical protein